MTLVGWRNEEKGGPNEKREVKEDPLGANKEKEVTEGREKRKISLGPCYWLDCSFVFRAVFSALAVCCRSGGVVKLYF